MDRGEPHRKPSDPRLEAAPKGAGTGMEELVLEPVAAPPESKPASTPPEPAVVDDWEIVPLDSVPPPPHQEVTSPAFRNENALAQAPGRHGVPTTPAQGKDNEMVNINPPVQEKRTIVEEGTKLNGNLESACPVVVHGCVQGDVQAPSLTVSGTGRVEGTAKVGIIRCEGELAGEFDADHVVLSGTIRDNTVIRAATIEMKLSGKRGKKQIIFGDSEVPEEVEAVVDAAAGPSNLPGAAKDDKAASAKPSERPDADKDGETASGKDSEPPAKTSGPRISGLSDLPSVGPVNGRASQPPPPGE